MIRRTPVTRHCFHAAWAAHWCLCGIDGEGYLRQREVQDSQSFFLGLWVRIWHLRRGTGQCWWCHSSVRRQLGFLCGGQSERRRRWRARGVLCWCVHSIQLWIQIHDWWMGRVRSAGVGLELITYLNVFAQYTVNFSIQIYSSTVKSCFVYCVLCKTFEYGIYRNVEPGIVYNTVECKFWTSNASSKCIPFQWKEQQSNAKHNYDHRLPYARSNPFFFFNFSEVEVSDADSCVF